MIEESFFELEDIISVKEISSYFNTVDISVEEDQSFTLSNGIISHNSALGSLLQKRDPKKDAVYALKGKVRNARRLSDLTSNSEIIDLMNILNIDPDNDRACKFEKVIIATDADPDGHHISSLIVNLFYRWFPNVIRQGRLYILRTPLIGLTFKGKQHYFLTFEEFNKFKEKNSNISNIRYFKGLGALNKEDWVYIFTNMSLFKIGEDTKAEKFLEMAFGTNAGLRKKWLQS